jgi:hypothetical protein
MRRSRRRRQLKIPRAAAQVNVVEQGEFAVLRAERDPGQRELAEVGEQVAVKPAGSTGSTRNAAP